MSNSITTLSKSSIELLRAYNLLLLYPLNQEECVAQIRNRVTMAYQHVQQNFIERWGRCLNKAMKEEVVIPVSQRWFQKIKMKENEDMISGPRRLSKKRTQKEARVEILH